MLGQPVPRRLPSTSALSRARGRRARPRAKRSSSTAPSRLCSPSARGRDFTGCWQSRTRRTPRSQARAPSQLSATSPAAGSAAHGAQTRAPSRLRATSPAAGRAATAHAARVPSRLCSPSERARDSATLHRLPAPLTAHSEVTDARLRATSPAAGRSTRRPAPARGSPSRCTPRCRTRACRRRRCPGSGCRRCHRPCRGSWSRCRGIRC